MAMTRRAVAAGRSAIALAAAACSQPLKLMKDDSADGPVAADDHGAESRPTADRSR